MSRSPFTRLAVSLGAALATACTVAGVGKYPSAGVFAATAIGATAVNRAANGGCWSSCPYGRVCDHASGFCVEPPVEPDRLDAGANDAPRNFDDASDEGTDEGG